MGHNNQLHVHVIGHVQYFVQCTCTVVRNHFHYS